MTLPNFTTWDGLTEKTADRWDGLRSRLQTGAIRAVIGWNGVTIWDDDVNPVDLVRAYVEQARKESCGQCFPCRLGTEQLSRIMEKICSGQGEEKDLAKLETLARRVSETARCDIGQTLAKPIVDLLNQRMDDFLAVVREHTPVTPGSYEATVTAPCMAACPSNVDVPGYLEAVRLGRWSEGLEVARRDCPLPGTIGRVCVRPCESACRRGLIDAPLAIKPLKRFLADHELAAHNEPQLSPEAEKPQKVAVIGAGPAGLSCAYYLGLKGYRCTVFEAQDGPGGMAAWGIPSYRLPRDILNYEASLVEKLGGEIRYGVKIGKDLTIDDLTRQGYDAVFVGVGAPESSAMRCEGEEAGYEGFMTGIGFLEQVSRGKKPLDGRKLLVIGGGNVAMDCVRSALRIGFEDVNLLYRRTESEMPADRAEIDEAKEEGVIFNFLVAPVRIVAENNKVVGLECLRMELGEPDASGRRRPVAVEGSNFVIDCDAVIPAVGQACIVDYVLPKNEAVTRWKTLVVDELTFQVGDSNLFGGGDCVTGPYTLISALAAGKKAARFIEQYLKDGSCTLETKDVLERLIKDSGVFDPAETFPFPGISHRGHPEVLTPTDRVRGFEEVEGCLTPSQAVHEASRCLRCYRIAVAAV